MELLSLEINKHENEEIIDNMEIITNLEQCDINIEISHENEKIIKIRYLTKDASNKKQYLEIIIGKLTKLLNEHVRYVSYEYLTESYFYFEEDEFEKIKEFILEEIDNDVKIKLIIKNKLKEVIEKSKSINLNGFIKFRLKFIKPYAERIVEKCIDDYLMKKEYFDFINIIKYFSDNENDKYNELNIMYSNDKLQIYDNYMKKLNYIATVEMSCDFDAKELEYDENIINILLSISPPKIKIHTRDETLDTKSENTLNAIQKIFADKVEICHGCRFCNLLI